MCLCVCASEGLRVCIPRGFVLNGKPQNLNQTYRDLLLHLSAAARSASPPSYTGQVSQCVLVKREKDWDRERGGGVEGMNRARTARQGARKTCSVIFFFLVFLSFFFALARALSTPTSPGSHDECVILHALDARCNITVHRRHPKRSQSAFVRPRSTPFAPLQHGPATTRCFAALDASPRCCLHECIRGVRHQTRRETSKDQGTCLVSMSHIHTCVHMCV